MSARDFLLLVAARGGSKGLPRKNARTLGGYPLLDWTMAALRAADLGGHACVLSTDDQEIAEIGRSVGLAVPFLRPAELSSDTAMPLDVLRHALEWYRGEKGRDPFGVMWLQPTSPLRSPAALREAVAMLSGDVDAVLGLKPLHRSTSNMFRADSLMALTALDASAGRETRRQALEPLYTPNGAIYLTRTQALLAEETLVPRRTTGLIMDQIAAIDIDELLDLEIAEAVVAAGLAWRKGKGSK